MIRKCLLSFVCILQIYITTAQNKKDVDTIRRELTVENEKYIKVNKETPLPFEINMQKPQTQSVNGSFDLSNSYLSPMKISQIEQLPSFISPKMIEKKNKGYINVFGGLLFNAGVIASIDAINNNGHKLSVDFSSMYTNYNFLKYGFRNKVKELFYKPQVRYDYNREGRHIYASANFFGGQKNYYGINFPVNANIEKQKITPIRNFNHFNISGGIDNELLSDTKWNYSLNAGVKISNSRYNKYNFQDVNSISAFDVSANGLFSYSINNENSLNVYPEVEYYIYNTDKAHNLFYTNISPTYKYNSSNSDMSWLIELGIGLTLNNKSLLKGNSNMYLWPKLKLGFAYSDFFDLNMDICGGDEITDLVELENLMPYYSFINSYWNTQNRIKAKLDMSFLFTNNFKLSLYSAISQRNNILQFAPQYIGLDQSLNNIMFSSYRNDYTKFTIGGNIHYRLLNDLLIKADFNYNIFSKYEYMLPTEPQMKGMIALEYKPIDKWLINLSYNLINGIRYKDIDSDKFNRLPLYQSLSANIDYAVLKNLTLYTAFQTALSKNTDSMYPYYPRQENILLLGLNFHF